jgi:hypothetical protein
MQAIITLVHGTWASDAAWTHPDSALRQSLHETAAHKGVQVEFRTHTWSGSNSFKAREEAARTLIERLRQDFEQSPSALHFLIGHSHGGNIAIDAVRAHGIGDRVSGIVTMSTPFVSCRRSGAFIPASVIGTVVGFQFVLWYFYLLFLALYWVWNQVESISSPLIRWPLVLFVLYIAMRWSGDLVRTLSDVVWKAPIAVGGFIRDWQDTVLERFSRHLEKPIPIFCVRFRLDEALVALNVSRFVVKPIRVLTIAAASMAAIGGLLWWTLFPLGILVGLIILLLKLFSYATLGDSIEWAWAYLGAVLELLFENGIVLTIFFLLIWAIFGYIMVALTLGGWGNIFHQLLVDFRVTETPEGADATSKVFSGLRWRRTLLHSLTYGDRKAVAEISHWIASRMHNDTKIGPPDSGVGSMCILNGAKPADLSVRRD